jgi:hypothetical protein
MSNTTSQDPKVELNNALQKHTLLFRFKSFVRYTKAERVSTSPDRWKVQCYLEGTSYRVTSDPCSSKSGAEDDAATKMKDWVNSVPVN